MGTESDQTPLIAVVGETASGKSALALEIAKKYNGELVCADSRTIYKGMDIGTAKPTGAEQAEVPHHLLDVVDPTEKFSAADFRHLAEQAIRQIASRGKLPILVGGSGLYVDSVIFDYTFSGKPTEKERQQLEALNLEELRHRIKRLGTETPVNEKNKRHLIRTLERGGVAPDNRAKLRRGVCVIGLYTSRNRLRERIETRVEQMFRRGLRKEVEELRQRYGWGSEALTGIGYREFKSFYEGQASMSEVKRRIIQDTLGLAKRQRTWFKRNPHIVWVESLEQGIRTADAFLKQYKL